MRTADIQASQRAPKHTTCRLRHQRRAFPALASPQARPCANKKEGPRKEIMLVYLANRFSAFCR